ncbi:MAG: YitT family protein, partial [Candidatus Aminicenantes bacterium]|nr:YitT family protein [Candidatus Aminicenantes bacterium]
MNTRTEKAKQFFHDAALVVAGGAVMGAGYAMFLIPHHFVPGGVSGVAIIINSLTRLPVGTLILVLNIPVFALGYKIMGRTSAVRGLAGLFVSSLFIDLFNEVIGLPSATGNVLLGAIYGGILLGTGLGLVFRGRSSTGGSDIIGQILNRYTGLSIGMTIMIVDFFIISASGFVFGRVEAPLYGYIVLFVSSKVIDMVLEGWSFTKMAIITSSRVEEIQEFIVKTLDRSGTALRSRSLYLNREGETIITVLSPKQ